MPGGGAQQAERHQMATPPSGGAAAAAAAAAQSDKFRQMEGVMKKLALWHTRIFRPLMTHDDLEPVMISLGFVPLPVPPPQSTPSSTTSPKPPLSSSSPSSSSATPTPASTAAPWREYFFSAAARRHAGGDPEDSAFAATAGLGFVPLSSASLPRPRLPYPRIDGLHILVYRAFIDAVAFYIGAHRVADHFHVRGMPLHRIHDRPYDKVFRMMSDDRRHPPASSASEDEGIFVFREGTLDQATLTMCGITTNNSGSNPGINVASGTTTATATAASAICLVPLKDINVVIAAV